MQGAVTARPAMFALNHNLNIFLNILFPVDCIKIGGITLVCSR